MVNDNRAIAYINKAINFDNRWFDKVSEIKLKQKTERDKEERKHEEEINRFQQVNILNQNAFENMNNEITRLKNLLNDQPEPLQILFGLEDQHQLVSLYKG